MQWEFLILIVLIGAAQTQQNGNRNTKFASRSNSVSTSCVDGNCQTCINGKCFDRAYQNIWNVGDCPMAACEKGCNGMVYSDKDNCPICSCNGFSTREPCSTNAECLSPNGTCTSSLCRYPPVRDGLPKACSFAHECSPTDDCIQHKCQRDPGNRRHASNVSCVFDYNCPNKHTCDGMTCWEGGPEHTNDMCTFDYQCPTKYSCQRMSCIYTGKDHSQTMCVMDMQCSSGQRCISMTCQ